MFYFKRIPIVIQRLFPAVIWRFQEQKNAIYLTFDDGPDPSSTPDLLAILRKHNLQATFFCLGHKVRQHPELLHSIMAEGHTVGIHGYEHLSGWATDTNTYVENVKKAAELIPSKLFRPPFGRLKMSQYRKLIKQFRIVMWSAMPGDFDKMTDESQIKNFIINKIRVGDIIALHDNSKSLQKYHNALEMLAKQAEDSEISFRSI